MPQAIVNKSNLEFILDNSLSRRHPAKVICDTGSADDIAMLSNTLDQARLLFSRVETSAKQTGLRINNCKTKYIKCDQGERDLKALKGDDFLYKGSWIDSCSKDVSARIGKT